MPKQEKERIIADTVKLVINPIFTNPKQAEQNDKIVSLIKTVSSSYIKYVSSTKANADAWWNARSIQGSKVSVFFKSWSRAVLPRF